MLQQKVQAAQKFESEKRSWFSATSEDVVDDIIEARGLRFASMVHEGKSILYNGVVVWRELKVFAGELVDHSV